MTKDEVFAKVQEILVQEFELDKDAIQPEAKLNEDLDLDSIDAVDLIVRMKEYISGKVDPERFKNVRTVQDAVDILYSMTQVG
jgi:acyl carrier protein